MTDVPVWVAIHKNRSQVLGGVFSKLEYAKAYKQSHYNSGDIGIVSLTLDEAFHELIADTERKGREALELSEGLRAMMTEAGKVSES